MAGEQQRSLGLTARQQWFGQEDAPALQTISFNGRVTEKRWTWGNLKSVRMDTMHKRE
jgi:hypothetical protein